MAIGDLSAEPGRGSGLPGAKRDPRSVRAEVAIVAPREVIFSFLARLENHWQLTDRWIEVVRLDSDGGDGAALNGGAVRVRTPLGLSRVVRTRVVGVDPPERIHGIAELGRVTRAEVTWTLRADGRATRVGLEAEVASLAPLDAALWALGGRAWMRRRLEAVLAGLTRRFEAPR
ncbi:MAG TPA: SRPBCC family protein [Solirubrobacterales bacterium]|nr:SRPBCC family protein [Solirubrobacterales bacterium]